MATGIKTQVIDADAHVIETELTWDFLDPGDQKYRPVLAVPNASSGSNGARRAFQREYWVVDGQVRGFRFPTLTEIELEQTSQRSGRNVQTSREAREMENVQLRLEHMDRLGIDIQVLHHTLFIEQVTDRPEIDVAICKAWNKWMAHIFKQGNGRLLWACVPSMLSISDAIEQIRAARESGAVAVAIRPLEGRRGIADPYFYPIYEEAQRLDMAMAVHIGNANPDAVRALRSPYDPGSSFAAYRVPTVVACHTLLMSELPQLFPTLRWGFIETAAQWLPWVLREAASRHQGQGQTLNMKTALQDYRIYVTCQTDDDIPYLVDQVGEDNLVIGTDYGHFDPSSNIDAIQEFRESTGLTERVKNKILCDNPKALYGL